MLVPLAVKCLEGQAVLFVNTSSNHLFLWFQLTSLVKRNCIYPELFLSAVVMTTYCEVCGEVLPFTALTSPLPQASHAHE